MTEGRARKRRWDLDDQGQSAAVEAKEQATREIDVQPTTERTEPALSAASEIAAKIKANLEAKGIVLEEQKEENIASPAIIEEPFKEEKPVEPSSAATAEPSLLESLGITEEAKKRSEKKARIEEEFSIVRKLDINDTRHRYYLTKASTQEAIEKEFGVRVVSKGKYCPDRRLATEKDPPLFLEIHGKNEDDTDSALAKLVIMIEKGPPNVAPVSLNLTPSFFSEKVFVNIEPTEAIPAFSIRGKVLGPQGSFLKHIQSQTGCKVHLRGKGSGYVDLGANEEVLDELHLYISSLRKEDVEQAKVLCEDLLTHVRKEVETANAAKQSEAAAVPAYNQMVHQPYGYPQYYQQPPYYPGQPPQQYYPPPPGQMHYAPQAGYAPPVGYPPQVGQPLNPYTSPPHSQYPGYYSGYPTAVQPSTQTSPEDKPSSSADSQ